MSASGSSLTLQGAGVSRAAAERLIAVVRPLLRSTDTEGRAIDVPGFASAVRIGDLALVATTDGVGTKRALMSQRMSDLGRDLVAYNVNDVAVVGGRPLAFLDYLSWGRLDQHRAERLFEGMAAACIEAGCILLGGETAEHPGLQAPGDLDLAGFAVGIAPVDELVTGADAAPGDPIVGVASSGPHASGFSLIRHAFARAGRPVPETMLTPTPVYVPTIAALRERCRVRALAHVCDGGLVENVVRALPAGLGAELWPDALPRPAWFDELVGLGCAENELLATVNSGVGITVAVAPGDEATAVAAAADHGHRAHVIGRVVDVGDGPRVRYAR
jgi:phosphoribosylformylglycinamidine cyclo-ligase